MSLEALIAFAALLSALAILISAANSMNSDFSAKVSAASGQAQLSYSALSLDTAGSLRAVQLPRQQGSAELGGWEISAAGGAAPEPMFHYVSGEANVIGIQTEKA